MSRRPLRRAERELTDPADIAAVLAEAPLLYLSFHDEPAPYVVPVSFGVTGDTLWVHGAREGTKIDLLRADPRVGFAAATAARVTGGPGACAVGARGRSVAGTAVARIVEDEAERRRGLDAIMRHHAAGAADAPGVVEPPGGYAYEPAALARTCVIALRIVSIRAKRTG